MTHQHRLLREVHGKMGATHSALYAPHPSLTGCVCAYLSRSTTEAAALAPDECRNHFPPTPTCVIVWVIQGQDSRVPRPDAGQPADDSRLPVMFSGPHTRPSFSDNSSAVQFFTLLMYPDALRSLTGVEVGPHLDRYSPFCSVFDADWLDMARSVLTAQSDEARIQLIEDFLSPRWISAQLAVVTDEMDDGATAPTQPVAAMVKTHRLKSWSSGVARRALQQGREYSERQVDRRIKSWTGQNLKQLRGVGRIEGALLGANQTAASAAVGWSALAADCGFSDQAHMCREFRRYMGMRPGDMRRRLSHESFWVFRIWT